MPVTEMYLEGIMFATLEDETEYYGKPYYAQGEDKQTDDSVVRLAVAPPHSPFPFRLVVLAIPSMGHMVPASTLVPLTKNVSNDLAELLNNASPTNPTQPATALRSPQVIVSAVVVINS